MKTKLLVNNSSASLFSLIALLLPIAVSAQGDECSSVLALSRYTTQTQTSRSAVENEAAAFCREYAQNESRAQAMSASGSYKLLSASFGSSSASARAISERYCSSSDRSSAKSDSYVQFVDGVDPGAFQAYQVCKQHDRRSTKFSVVPPTPSDLTVYARFVGSGAVSDTTARYGYTSSNGISCNWQDSSTPSLTTVPRGGLATLKCARTDASTEGRVTVHRQDDATVEPLPLTWVAFTPSGIPVPTVQGLQERYNALELRQRRVEDAMAARQVERGSVDISARPGSRSLRDKSVCPPAPDGLRGTTEGKVSFAKRFARPPIVQAGLVYFETGIASFNDVNRLRFNVLAVNEEGFSYSFITWCTTDVVGAQVSWIAISD